MLLGGKRTLIRRRRLRGELETLQLLAECFSDLGVENRPNETSVRVLLYVTEKSEITEREVHVQRKNIACADIVS